MERRRKAASIGAVVAVLAIAVGTIAAAGANADRERALPVAGASLSASAPPTPAPSTEGAGDRFETFEPKPSASPVIPPVPVPVPGEAVAVAPPPASQPPAPAPASAPAAPDPTPATLALPPGPIAADVELARLRTLELAFDAVIPPPWRSRYPRSYAVDGTTPVTWDNGAVIIPAAIVDGDPTMLRVVVAHEWGHVLTVTGGAGFGSPPAGFPAGTADPDEEWADCVSAVLTGVVAPSHGLPPCSPSALAWVAAFLAAGPR